MLPLTTFGIEGAYHTHTPFYKGEAMEFISVLAAIFVGYILFLAVFLRFVRLVHKKEVGVVRHGM
jgi:hypothetical protein